MRRAAQDFEQMVMDVLAANDFAITKVSGPASAFDFTARLLHDTWAVEVKHYRTSRAQPSLIEAAAAKLTNSAASAKLKKAILVVSCFIDPALRYTLENKFGVILIDSVDLTIWARVEPRLVDELARFIDSPDLSAVTAHHPKEISGSEIYTIAPEVVISKGGSLCKRLQNLGKGKKYWHDVDLHARLTLLLRIGIDPSRAKHIALFSKI